ncbi:hypothetical protein QSJ18_09360 [Gordonia sp. ABSL1-1]|uniref:hypothetical protein n=1 Tax=Gordonia sp. ABSL1-1 TaxID=3053923 RepID=UPI0025734CF5|nr:hypothetical protein [Gordonia sp. ABSL1-1]MDL9936946.1 hypothetical protein [Gordonia sp. ABSL1-1]
MSFFRRRTDTPPVDPAQAAAPSVDPAGLTPDQVAWIRARALATLTENGVEAIADDNGVDLVADGHRMPLDNALAKCRAANPDDWSAIVEQHFGALARQAAQPGVDQLTGDQLASQVRTRLVHIDDLRVPIDPSTVIDMTEYALPVADDLAAVLCIDFPETVTYLNSERARSLDLPALYTHGQANTDAEPLDEVFTTDEGRIAVGYGSSLFVASKALNMPALLHRIFGSTDTPHGVVFATPNRNEVLLHRISADNSITAIGSLASLAAARFDGAVGAVSPNIYFWHQGTYLRISTADPVEKSISITPGPQLESILADLS